VGGASSGGALPCAAAPLGPAHLCRRLGLGLLLPRAGLAPCVGVGDGGIGECGGRDQDQGAEDEERQRSRREASTLRSPSRRRPGRARPVGAPLCQIQSWTSSPTPGCRQTRRAALHRRGGGGRIEGRREEREFAAGFLKISLKCEGFFANKSERGQ